jgi:hypothetical protein
VKPVFTAPIAPGRVFALNRFVEYALAPSAGVRVAILDIFGRGDERARIDFLPFIGMSAEQAQDFVDTAVYRRVVAAASELPENLVVVPDRIASWPLGMTEADVAAANEKIRERAQRRANGVPSLTDYRRDRRAPSGPKRASPPLPAAP